MHTTTSHNTHLDGVLGGGVGAAEGVAARDAGDGGDGDDAALAALEEGQEGLAGRDDAEEVHLCVLCVFWLFLVFGVCGDGVWGVRNETKRNEARTSMQKRKSCSENQSMSPERATPAVGDACV